MAARLYQGDESLVLKLGGTKEEFAAQLARAKAVAGRRYNDSHPEHGKVWEFPDTDETLIKVVYTVEPHLTAELERRIQGARQQQAESLLTQLPDDAPVAVPWQGRLAGKQRSAIDFGATHEHILLADDMGAGKTVEAISICYEHVIRQEGAGGLGDEKFLVICPNSVMGHWRKELKKWVGLDDEDIQIVDGKTKEKREAQLENPDAIWFIVNWEKLSPRVGLVRKLTKEPKRPLEKIQFHGIIADEAHKAKNPDAQRTKSLWKLRAPVQVAASGTPVMNNPGELWSLLHWLQPEQYTGYWQFFHSYTESYEGYKGKPTIIGVKNVDGLRFELADKMVRRTKRQIHPDIPKPFEPIVYEPDLGKDQRQLYEKGETDFWLELAKEAEDPEVTDLDKTKLEQILEAQVDNRETVRLMIPNAATRTIRLRQLATNPAIIGGPDVSSKMDDIERVVGEYDDRPWAFFAWFQESVELLCSRFQNMGLDARCFHGGNSEQEERTQLSAEFQAGEFQIIVASIGTGGEGIEFFRASDCGFLEEEWVPGLNDQAFDRVDRKGQTTRPQRHIWRAPGTVDTGSIAPKNATKRLITTTILGDRDR